MNSVTIDFEARFHNVHAEVGKLGKEIEGVGNALRVLIGQIQQPQAGTTSPLGKLLDQDEKRLKRLAEQYRTAFQTPMSSAWDKKNQSIYDIDRLRASGQMNPEDAARAKRQATEAFYRDSGLADQLRAQRLAQRDALLASGVLGRAGREQQTVDDLRQLRLQQRDMLLSQGVMGRAARDANNAVGADLSSRLSAGMSEQQWRNQQKVNEKVAEYNRLLKSGAIDNKTFGAAMKELRQEMSGADQLFGSMSTKVMGFVGGLLSAQTALALLRAEYENIQSRQTAAATTTLSYAQALEQASNNSATIPQKELDRLVRDKSTKQSLNPTVMMNAVNTALGSRGNNVTEQQAIDAVFEVAEFNRLNPSNLSPTVAALLQMEGSGEKGTRKGFLGQMMMAQVSSKVSSQANFASYIAPRAASARAFGDTPQQAYGLMAYLSNASGDEQGRVTGTAFTDWEKDLEILSNAYPGLGANTHERAKNIATNPKFAGLRDKLLGRAEDTDVQELYRKAGRMTSEARSYGPIKLLYENDPSAWKAVETKMAEQADSLGGGEAFANRKAADRESADVMATARAGSRMEAATENTRLANQTEAKGGSVRDNLRKQLEASGQSALWQRLSMMSFEGDSGLGTHNPYETAAGIVSAQADSLRHQARNVRRMPTMARRMVDESWTGSLMKAVGIDLSPPEASADVVASYEQRAAGLEGQASVLEGLVKQLIEEQKKSNERPIEITVEAKVPVRARVAPPGKRAGEALGGGGKN